MKKLEYLKITDYTSDDSEEIIIYFREIFSSALFSVKRLEISLGNGRFVHDFIHVCFPNLNKLLIKTALAALSKDFIYNLTKLDQLKSLTFEEIENLTDEHFVRIYNFTENDGNKISILPAIAGFKSLRSLHIIECIKLTDNCLKNGLAFCTTLENINLCYGSGGARAGKFTNDGVK